MDCVDLASNNSSFCISCVRQPSAGGGGGTLVGTRPLATASAAAAIPPPQACVASPLPAKITAGGEAGAAAAAGPEVHRAQCLGSKMC